MMSYAQPGDETDRDTWALVQTLHEDTLVRLLGAVKSLATFPLRPDPTMKLGPGMAFSVPAPPERRIRILVVGHQRENQ
jgi:hypothetical protein